MDVTSLFVKKSMQTRGPTMKRWKAGSRGMAKPLLKRDHVGVVVAERE